MSINATDPGTPFSQEKPAKPLESESSNSLKQVENTSPALSLHNPCDAPLEGVSANVGPRRLPSKHISPELDDPNLEYAQIKSQLVNAKRSNTSQVQKSDVVNVLEERLRAVKRHYFFDERDAERLYRSELEKVNAQLLQATLRGPLEPAQPISSKNINVPTTVATIPDPKLQPDLFDQEDNESSGGLLEILDAPSEVEGPRGTMIPVKDMSLQKQSGGKLPRVILSEYVSKADRYAAVTFGCLSGQSRAKRFGVQVLWGGHRMNEWKMEDVACNEEPQAQQYIATVALHALSFPPTEGFAAGSMSSPIGTTFFRLFPSAFRDLWDELETGRKLKQARINREIWAKLWSIISQKIDNNRDVSYLSIRAFMT